jgi:predicted MPP superfamily phosphohydrolase
MLLALTLLLFALAALGHLALMVTTHNWCYGQPLPRHSGKFVHLTFGLLILAGPTLLLSFWGWDLLTLFTREPFCWGRLLTACYVALCWLTGLVLLPLDTVRRLRRTTPPVQSASRSQIVNLEKELGGFGRLPGKRGLLARLPGNEIFQVELSERTLCLPRLPQAWDGLTVLHLSDLHFNGVPPRVWQEAVIRRCAAWEPDLVALTGDVTDRIACQEWIVPLLSGLRWREAGFAILGNHDYWYDVPTIRARLMEAGLRVLPNRWEQVEVRGLPLVVIGHEGPWLRPPPDLSACPHGPFRLCLSHTPDNLLWGRRAGIDLMLSGHVHGGQIRFPLFGSVLVPSVYGRRYDCGVFHEPPTVLHVSRGLSGDQPVRYRCLPEVTLLTLRAVSPRHDR